MYKYTSTLALVHKRSEISQHNAHDVLVNSTYSNGLITLVNHNTDSKAKHATKVTNDMNNDIYIYINSSKGNNDKMVNMVKCC